MTLGTPEPDEGDEERRQVEEKDHDADEGRDEEEAAEEDDEHVEHEPEQHSGPGQEEEEDEGEMQEEADDATAGRVTGKRRARETERPAAESKHTKRRKAAAAGLTLEQQEALARRILQQSTLE